MVQLFQYQLGIIAVVFILSPQIANGFQAQTLLSNHHSQSIQTTSLFLKVERYTYDDPSNSGADEDLFATIDNKNRVAHTDLILPVPGNTNNNNNNSTAYENGVREPTPDLTPKEIVPLIMNALKNNDTPKKDAGVQLVWDFATDTTQYVFKNNVTEFIESCHETADEFPTSFYGVALNGQSWVIETEINRVGGDNGWIATQVMKTISSDGRMRRWQWELRKNKRPPCLGCWKVENIASSDRNGEFEPSEGDGWSD